MGFVSGFISTRSSAGAFTGSTRRTTPAQSKQFLLPLGLDRLDLSYLEMLIRQYKGGPVGIETLAAAVGEQADTLQDVCEPYLMKLGFLQRTPRGRQATERSVEHIGADALIGEQSRLPDI